MDTSQPPITPAANDSLRVQDTSSSQGCVSNRIHKISTLESGKISSAEPAAFLVGVVGPAEGVLVELDDAMYIVGRSGQSSIRVNDCRMSREHALLLVKANGGVTLIDLHASNGTVVNGEKVKRTVLNDGDRIEIGESIFRFARERPQTSTDNDSVVDETTC